MLILLNILGAIAYVIDAVLTFFMIVLFARVILSWIRIPYSQTGSQITRFLYQVTEPVLQPIRRRMPISCGIDFSPMIVFLLLIVLRMVIVNSLLEYVTIYRLKLLGQ
jgi:YggT family protein